MKYLGIFISAFVLTHTATATPIFGMTKKSPKSGAKINVVDDLLKDEAAFLKGPFNRSKYTSIADVLVDRVVDTVVKAQDIMQKGKLQAHAKHEVSQIATGFYSPQSTSKAFQTELMASCKPSAATYTALCFNLKANSKEVPAISQQQCADVARLLKLTPPDAAKCVQFVQKYSSTSKSGKTVSTVGRKSPGPSTARVGSPKKV